MNRVEDLKQIADEMLGGLKPSEGSFERIINSGTSPVKQRSFPLKRIAALSCAFLLVVTSGYFALRPSETALPGMETVSAGVPFSDTGYQTQRALAVPRGSVTLGKDSSPAYLGLWAKGKGANFPMVAAEGRYYRLLTNPTSIDADMLGASLGTVNAFTDEPALVDAGNKVVSNIVPEGTPVYQLLGMENAAAAAMVEGEMRVFQRVSFSGNAVLGDERLTDTLGAGSIKAMQLSGVGTVTDPDAIDTLMGMLDNAVYKGSGSKSTKQALLIEYDNHIVLQLGVKDTSLIGCGTFSCPDFITAFADSVRE